MIYQNKKFQSYHGHFWQRIYGGHEFHKCRFVGCSLSNTRKPGRRSTLRDVKFIDCEFQGCDLGTATVEEVVVDRLNTHGHFATWAAVFKHVTLKGKIGPFMLSPAVSAARASTDEQRSFDEANAAFYATVDWALDICEAQFAEADLRGVPGHLIRRDPETQVLIKREKALEGTWRKLDLSETYWPVAIEFFLNSNMDSIVLAAPRQASSFRLLLNGLELLRQQGVAEHD
jgi:hypothetical protein